MKTFILPQILSFVPMSSDDDKGFSGREERLYTIATDINLLYVYTVQAKASYLQVALKDAGVEYVDNPIHLQAEVNFSTLWNVDIVSPNENVDALYRIGIETQFNAIALATLLSSVFPRHEVHVNKYNHTRFIFEHGLLKHNRPELNLDACRTQYGLYRLPKDWL